MTFVDITPTSTPLSLRRPPHCKGGGVVTRGGHKGGQLKKVVGGWVKVHGGYWTRGGMGRDTHRGQGGRQSGRATARKPVRIAVPWPRWLLKAHRPCLLVSVLGFGRGCPVMERRHEPTSGPFACAVARHQGSLVPNSLTLQRIETDCHCRHWKLPRSQALHVQIVVLSSSEYSGTHWWHM